MNVLVILEWGYQVTDADRSLGLAGQPASLLGEFQASERACVKNQGEQLLRNST